MMFKTIITAILSFTIGALILVGAAVVNNNQLIAQNGSKIINIEGYLMDNEQETEAQ